MFGARIILKLNLQSINMHNANGCYLSKLWITLTSEKLKSAIKTSNMKTICLVFIFVIRSAFTFAQTTEHLSFKGVPINGTLNQYISKMKQTGFTHIRTEDGMALLTGDFAGYKDCAVVVSTLKQNDLVNRIGVLFNDKETWSSLSNNYFDLKQMLSEKYGEPSDVVEKFDGYPQPRDDGDRMHMVKFDNCKYSTVWETDKGEIQLSIEHNSSLKCFVTLVYFDKINSEKVKAKAIDDL